MSPIVKHLGTLAVSVAFVGLACAQTATSQTKPGTVPVTPSNQDKSGFGNTTPATAGSASAPAKPPTPAKAAARQPEAIQSTKRFAEHTGLVRTSEVVGIEVKDAADKNA